MEAGARSQTLVVLRQATWTASGPGGLQPRGRTRTGLEVVDNPVHGADGQPSACRGEGVLTVDLLRNVSDVLALQGKRLMPIA